MLKVLESRFTAPQAVQSLSAEPQSHAVQMSKLAGIFAVSMVLRQTHSVRRTRLGYAATIKAGSSQDAGRQIGQLR